MHGDGKSIIEPVVNAIAMFIIGVPAPVERPAAGQLNLRFQFNSPVSMIIYSPLTLDKKRQHNIDAGDNFIVGSLVVVMPVLGTREGGKNRLK